MVDPYFVLLLQHPQLGLSAPAGTGGSFAEELPPPGLCFLQSTKAKLLFGLYIYIDGWIGVDNLCFVKGRCFFLPQKNHHEITM